MDPYFALKHLHMGLAGLSYSLFVLRGVWLLRDSPRLRRRWVRIVPHVNDTLLLLAGVTLAVSSRQYPFVDAWLTVKLGAVLAYIILGFMTFRFLRRRGTRLLSWVAAQAVFVYIVSVAVTHSPLPW